MITSLNDAPVDRVLTVVSIRHQGLAGELAKLGLAHGRELIKLEQDKEAVQPMRLRTPDGDVILSGNMASGLMVHLDDGRIAPLLDLEPGQAGHLEGVTVMPDSPMADTFATLGLREDDPVELIRKLPPMEYVILVNEARRITLPGGMAAKVWGQSQGRMMQLASAGTVDRFEVTKILGGYRAQERMLNLGLEPGQTLMLEAVKPAQIVRLAEKNPVAAATPEGLRFWLPPQAARLLMVEYQGDPAD